MKIAICGKGGCGKSTVTTLMAKGLAADGRKVLVIDCDESNYGLHQQLGMALPETFIDYFGGKGRVMGLLAEGPRNMPALFERRWTLCDIPPKYVAERNGIMLMSPGKIETANEACACPFNALMCQFVPNLDLDDDDVILMDMEAGIEHFGRGTDEVVDAIVMIVDPSYESIKLSHKISEIGTSIGKPVLYVLNKITNSNRDTVLAGLDDPSKVAAVVMSSDSIASDGLLGNELEDTNVSRELAMIPEMIDP